MRLKITTALLACAGAAWLFTPAVAEARSEGPTDVSSQSARVVTTTRSRSRIVVRPRSYLDPGPEVPPHSQHHTNYLFLGRSSLDVLGPGQTRDRQPFPYTWEPGGSWRIQ